VCVCPGEKLFVDVGCQCGCVVCECVRARSGEKVFVDVGVYVCVNVRVCMFVCRRSQKSSIQ
jgi:hypothetical protein